VLYEDADRRGRAPGEVPTMLHDELLRVAPATTCVEVRTVDEAVPAALALARPGDVVLLLYEKIEPVLALLESLGARHADDLRVTDVNLGMTMAWIGTG
jgi:cyanophycin synthetase